MTRPCLNTSSMRHRTTTRRRWNDLAGPPREVVHIFEREGPRGGPYWRLVLECRHSVARKRHDPKDFTAMAQVMFPAARRAARSQAGAVPLLRVGVRGASSRTLGSSSGCSGERCRDSAFRTLARSGDAMRCGVCGAALRVRGYRSVEVSRGKRRVPLYQPCPNLDDPERHPARAHGRARTRKLAGATIASTFLTSTRDPPPFSRGSRLRFLGSGPFATSLATGTEVMVRSTCGTRSIFEGGGLFGAIWPEHAAHWQVIDPADPAVPRVTSNTSVK